jgi:electron transfer flavoprotein alpha subunit
MNAVLLVMEHHEAFSPVNLSTLSAALKISTKVDAVVLGHNLANSLLELKKLGVFDKVWVGDSLSLAHPLAEQYAPILAELAKAYTHVIFPATTFGKNIMPRLGALLDVQPISEITHIISPDTFERPIYAGNAILTVQSSDKIKLISVRATAFDKYAASNAENKSSEIVNISSQISDYALSIFKALDTPALTRPELTAAKIVVSGGRGLKNKENFILIEQLADILGAAVGATRAAVDAGFVPNDYQVGQTGKIVAPVLYIAIGISGAIQHIAGMKDSKIIVAINKDPDAPIFKVADYGLVGDLFELVPALVKKLKC